MKQKIVLMLLFLVSLQLVVAQKVIQLWPNGAPGNNECPQPEEMFNGKMVRFVSVPTLTIYLPDKDKNTGAAVVICPGGGYSSEAMDYEGYDYAEYLQSNGIAGIVLKYRLPYGHHEIPLMDAQYALRTVRYNAAEWGIDETKIGISGFSAGGHLASTAATHFDKGKANTDNMVEKVSCRPDFAILVYPVITFNELWGHMGSRENLMGKNHDLRLINYYSNELQVTTETPSTFLTLADDDKVVPPRNSIEFYSALKEKGVPAELHIFREGGHGFGMKKKGKPHDQWPRLLIEWMKAEKILK
jgi:acetyl esterase/lipase